jgi:hypothetical protein
VIVEGHAQIIHAGANFQLAIDLLVTKYPQYRTLPLDRTGGVVIAITPNRVLAWRAA